MPEKPYKKLIRTGKERMEKAEFFKEFKEALIEELAPIKEELGKIKLAVQILKDKVKTAPAAEKKLKVNSPGLGTYKEKPKTKAKYETTKSEYQTIYQAGTEKAVLLIIDNTDIWVPRSCIESEIIEEEFEPQVLTIHDWVIKKKLNE